MNYVPFDSTSPSGPQCEAVYVVLLPDRHDERPAVLLNRTYECIGTLPRPEAIDLVHQAGGCTSSWPDYTGGDRPDNYAPDEPLHGLWLDAGATSRLRMEVHP